jgi:hypothetical protein
MAAHAPDRLRRGRAGARHRGGENRLKSGNFVADPEISELGRIYR